ncbi:MAG: hypothetical protein JXA96_17040 [Sedimentisphaerales bacterium]|nr:hypothetical protein [Sedimentisphaerales bacterium]
MNERIKSRSIATIFLYIAIFTAIVFSFGCSSFVKAIAREGMDDGKHAKIKNQSFSRHFKDAVLEDMSGIQPVIDKSKN